MHVTFPRDLWIARIRRFGDDELVPVALFEYEGDARDFFFTALNQVRGSEYKLSHVIMVCNNKDDVLMRARATVSAPSCTSNSWELVVEEYDDFAPVTIARGGSYDFVGANWERLF